MRGAPAGTGIVHGGPGSAVLSLRIRLDRARQAWVRSWGTFGTACRRTPQEPPMNALSRLAAACVLTLAIATPALAQTWNENGDAGDVVSTAQLTLGSGALTGINGQLTSPTDIDLYCIHLSAVPPAGLPIVQLNCII